MKPLPHQYEVTATAEEQGHVELTSRGLRPVLSAPPAAFNGPGDLWSPETLLVAAVADCLVPTFKAVASASKLKWTRIVCDANGTLDRAEGIIRFTGIQLHARLDVPPETDPDKAHKLLEKVEKTCLVANSLRFKPTFQADVVVEELPQLIGR
jgi:organic hydroperoxide reductase OsmC/OhrA